METINLDLLRLFVKVIQHGSFTKAATNLGLPKSTISKNFRRLEDLVGKPLLVRTTRSQSLTPEGQRLYDSCLSPLQTLEEAQKSVQGMTAAISGPIKLTGPEDLGMAVITPAMGELAQTYPHLKFSLHYSNTIVDLVKEGYDFAVRIGNLKTSGLKAKKLGMIQMILVASPHYLRSRKKIYSPKDIEDQNCLSLASSGMNNFWLLKEGSKQVKIKINNRIESNQMTSLIQMTLAGGGLLLAPHYLCRHHIKAGLLQRVLPTWTGPSFTVSLVSTQSTANIPRLNIVSETLSQSIEQELDWNFQ